MAQITNKGRRWIQHGDNHIVLTNNPSITNFQISATIHLPVLATGDITVRGPQHSSPTPTGFAAGSMINITTRPNTETDGFNNIFYMAHIRLNGGYGFTIGGANNVSCLPRRERFDDVAQTQTVRSNGLIFNKTSAFSLNGLGYQLGGENPIGGTVFGSTRRFDDILNDANVRISITARNGLATFTINGYGFTSCGFNGTNRTGLTERFDDSTSTNIARTSATARDLLAGFGMNNYGFTAGGETAGGIIVGNIERFNDITNTQTARIAAATSGALAGNSMNGYGFVYGGENPVGTNINTVKIGRAHV